MKIINQLCSYPLRPRKPDVVLFENFKHRSPEYSYYACHNCKCKCKRRENEVEKCIPCYYKCNSYQIYWHRIKSEGTYSQYLVCCRVSVNCRVNSKRYSYNPYQYRCYNSNHSRVRKEEVYCCYYAAAEDWSVCKTPIPLKHLVEPVEVLNVKRLVQMEFICQLLNEKCPGFSSQPGIDVFCQNKVISSRMAQYEDYESKSYKRRYEE